MQLDSLDGAGDKAPVTLICLPDQFDRVYQLMRLVSLMFQPFNNEASSLPRDREQHQRFTSL
jgi:hypothetical protein